MHLIIPSALARYLDADANSPLKAHCVSMLLTTAVCVDPAKYLPKPKSAIRKVVQMNLIMWLARYRLGFPCR